MKSDHEEIQEQLTLWALGVAPDAPLTSLIEHLAACPPCRRIIREVYEISGMLASGAKPLQPPKELKSKLMAQVRSDSGFALEEVGGLDSRVPLSLKDRSTERPALKKSKEGLARKFRLWVGAGLAAVLTIALAVGNASLSRRIERQEERLLEWETRYETDFSWLRSAEYLLVQEIGPNLVAELTPPVLGAVGGIVNHVEQGQRGEPHSAWGKATVYDAYENRVYLIVWVSGLVPGANYEVWALGDGEHHLVGALSIDDRGRACHAYPTDSRTAWREVEVREAGGKALLAGELYRPGTETQDG